MTILDSENFGLNTESDIKSLNDAGGDMAWLL